MPVDFTPSNSLIQAYLAGQSIARQRRQDKEDKDEKTNAKIERDKHFQEQIRQFEQQAKAAKERFDTEHELRVKAGKLQELDFKTNLIEKYYKGTPIPDMQENSIPLNPQDINIGAGSMRSVSTPSEFALNAEGEPSNLTAQNRFEQVTSPSESYRVFGGDQIPESQVNLNHPLLGDFGSMPSRESHARTQAELERLTSAPKNEQIMALEQLKTEGDAKLKAAELIAQTKRDQKLFENQQELVRLRARLQPGKEDLLERPLDPKLQIEYFGDYDPFRTAKTAFGGSKALTPIQQAEIKDLDTVTDKARDLLKLFELPDVDTPPEQLIKMKAAQKYFNRSRDLGIQDTITSKWKDILSKQKGGESDPDDAMIAAEFANLEQFIALANFGKVIPSGEKEMLTRIAPGSSHNQTMSSVASKLQAIIDRNERSRLTALGIAKMPQPNKQIKTDLDLNKFIVGPQ